MVPKNQHYTTWLVLLSLCDSTEISLISKMGFISSMVHITSVMHAPYIVFSSDFSFYKDGSHQEMTIKGLSGIKKSGKNFPLPYSGIFYRRSFTISHLPTLTSVTGFFSLFFNSCLVFLNYTEMRYFICTYSVLLLYSCD